MTGHAADATTVTNEGAAKAAAVDAAAAQAATHPDSTPAPPTEAQKEAGNYQKGHVRLHGMDISIENPAGTQRRPEWPPLAHHYGYFKGTIGKDKDHIDVFLTPDAHDESRPVFVIDQKNAQGGFDEHKVILGAATVGEAKDAYKANYSPGWKGTGAVTQMTLPQFKAWAADTAQTQKPASQAKHADAATLTFGENRAAESAAVAERNRALAAAAETSTLPWPTKGHQGGPAAEISVAKGADGWHFRVGFQTNGTGSGGPFSAHHYASAAEARGAAVDALTAKLPKNPEGVEKQHVARIREWLAKQDVGTRAAPAAATEAAAGKAPLTQQEGDQITGAAMLRLQVQLGIAPKAQKTAIGYAHLSDKAKAELGPAVRTMLAAESSARAAESASDTETVTLKADAHPFEKGDRVIIEPYSGKAGYVQAVKPAGNPDAGVTFVDVAVLAKALGREAPPKPPTPAERAATTKAAAKAAKAAAVELERSTFTALANDASWIGKSVQDLVAEIRTRVDTEHTKAPAILKMAAALHKQLAKNAVELEKAKHRDPAVYAAAVRDAAGPIDGEALAQFQAGFTHAMQGRTKSSMVGDRLPDMLKGYAAALEWRKTEEGRAWYEGRPVAKLTNTGVDLRRYWDAIKAELAAKQSDTAKAWAAIERATNRARMFAPLLGKAPKPGFQLYINSLRDNIKTFPAWLEDQYSWYGSYKSRRAAGPSNTAYMLEGKRYPSNTYRKLEGQDPVDEQRFQSDAEFRAAWLQEQAQRYMDAVHPLLEALSGATSVTDAAARFDAAFVDPDKRAAFVEDDKKPSDQRAKPRIYLESILNAAGKALDRAVFGGGKGSARRMLAGFASIGSTTEHLAEKEDTIALPSKATPLVAPKLDRVTREGMTDQRKGRDVTPAEFKAAFGFADVGFGSYVAAKQDQDHLNYAFDAFMDLANHFGIPPTLIGLGGKLHFTIGALGHGSKAAAHFNAAHPGPNGAVPVINLTNTKGDGTVYHEWMHAFDLVGARGDWARVRKFMQGAFTAGVMTPESVEAYADRFLFNGTYWKGDKNGDKVKAAVKGMSWMTSHAGTSLYKQNADKLGADYWGNDKELLARASEAWAVDTLGGTNTYLVNPAWAGEAAVSSEKGYRGTPYPTGTERKLFNALFTALTKATTVKDGALHVDYAAFIDAIPEEYSAGERRRKDLMVEANMATYHREASERRAAAQLERQAAANAKARAEREEQDRLAAAALAELAATAPVADPPAPAETQGALTEDDYSAIFDQAAAELREESSNEPAAPPPGEPAETTPAPAPAAAADAPAPKVAVVRGRAQYLERDPDTLRAYFQPGRVVPGYGGPDRVLALRFNPGGDWEVQVQRVAADGAAIDGERPRWHATAPEQRELVKLFGPATAAAKPAKAAKDAPAATSETAAALIAEAAKQGVTGADEAFKGLAAIFGAAPGRLNSFPSGFDEESYQRAKPHFARALEAFQAAGKSLKDLFKMLVQQYGDGIKEYAVRFAKDMQLSATLGARVSPSEQLADRVSARLASGQAFDWRALFADADAAFGGTQAEGTYTPKDAYDALEAGVNRYIASQGNAFSPQTDRAGALLVVDRLTKLMELVPTQTKRTAEQDEFQQFSTVPPFAYVANWVANVSADDTLLEPSAGIGGLAVFGKVAGAKLVLNELSARRAAVLQTVFPGAKVYQENAEQLDNILPADVTASVVVMNPPFSATAGRLQGERSTAIGAQHVTQALGRLAEGGRLVAIVGDGMRLDAPRFRQFWKDVQEKHTVRAVIPVDGSGYAKYGTTFDNVLLVIDKVAPAERVAPLTAPAKAYSDLVGLLAEIRNDRPAAAVPSNANESAERDDAESARGDAVPEGGRDAATGAAAGEPGVVGEGQSGSTAVVGGSAGAGAGARGGARPGSGVRRAGNPGAAGRDNAQGGRDGAAAPAGRPGADGHASGVSITASDNVAAELTDSTFEHYSPQRLQVPGAKPHPGPLVQSAAMASVLPPTPTYTPNLPKATIDKGLLSIAQIEAVVYAGQAHAELLPDGTRRAFFIGDGTGVGKGREIGGIILDNLRHGRKKAVWVSEKQDLFTDAKRDFGAVGGDAGVLQAQGKAKADATLSGDGVMYTTYDTLRSGSSLAPGKAKKAALAAFARFKPGAEVIDGQGNTHELLSIDAKNSRVVVKSHYYSRGQGLGFANVASINGDRNWQSPPKSKDTAKSRLDQLVEWLGPDFDGALVFDEAHNAGNAIQMKVEGGRGGSTQPSEKALAVVELQKRLPNARITYVSATGATTVSNLAYAGRLGLWGKGTPFASVNEFVAEMTAGGLATMELVARDMKQMGAYIARSLSFDGVEYDRVDHQLDDLQRDIYNRLAEGWQVVLQNMNEALELTGATENGVTRNSKAVAAVRSAFWGTQQRFFNQVITSMQMPSVLARIEQDLAAGNAVVLQLVNTNEAQQDRALAKKKEEGEADLEDLDLTPRDALLGMVEKAYPVVQMQTTMDDNGNKISTPVLDSSGKPVENKQAVAKRDALLADLQAIRVPDGPLEMLLNHFGPDVVAEVTGRSQRVIRRDEGEGLKAVLEKRGASSNKADADAFLADKKRILVFSDAGGTGYSFHADLTKQNQRRREHYLLQPGWRADKAVQGLGRSHRTNQASAPRFHLVATDIPAHKRFLSAIARRLDMLGAMTKGQRDTANQGLFSEKDNLESKYATQAVRQLLDDAKRGQIPGLDFMAFLKQLGLEGLVDANTGAIPEDKYPPTRQFLNRMLSLTLDMQQTVFDAFIERMEEKVEVAAQRGELDAGMQTVRALSTRIVQDETVYTDPRTGAETRYVELELTLPNRFYDFPEATKTREIEWVRNNASGRVWAKIKSGTETTKAGAVLDKFRLLGTSGLQVKNAGEFEGTHNGLLKYSTITEDEARELWAKETAERPDTITRPAHMIVGAMLPIWDRIKTEGTLQVMRTQTTDGQRLLGKLVLAKDVAEIRSRLDVSSPAAKLGPAEVMAEVLKGGVAKLANGWLLERARVSGELRIELKNVGYLYGPAKIELADMGVFSERIQWADRLFVPTGAAGVPVLTELFKSKPVVDITHPGEAEESALLRRREPETGRFTSGLPVEAVQAVVDRLTADWHGFKDAGFRVVVADGFADLPAKVQRDALRQGSQRHELLGAYDRGTLYVVAQNARKGVAGVEETIFHEAYGHAGLRLIFGRDTLAETIRLSKAIGGFDGMMRYARAHNIDLSAYARDLAADPTISPETRNGILLDELLAHMAEQGPPTLRQRALELLGKIKEWLRANGFAELAKYDGADLARLLQRSRQAVHGTRPGTGRVEIDTATPAAQQRDTATEASPEALDDLLQEHGEAVVSDSDAARRWNAGERLFGMHEQSDGEAAEITSHDMLKSYTPDQLLALPRSLATSLGIPEPAGPARFERAPDPSSPGFKAWFKASKVVTTTGRPRVVFHGTAEDFWAFDKKRLAKSTGHLTAPLGFFFDEGRGKAEHYAEQASQGVPADERVIEAYLSIQNPKTLTLDEFLAVDSFDAARALRDRLIRAGHDGIHLAERDQWVAFEPTQIKSAEFNNGNFDPADPDIRFSRAPTSENGLMLDQLEAGLSDDGLWQKVKSLAIEDLRPHWLGALTLRHLGELAAKILPQVGAFQSVVDQMNVDRNDMMHRAAGTADKWSELQAKQPETAQLLAGLMHDSTIAGVDPSENFVPGMLQATKHGAAEAITPASINARIQKLTAEKAGLDDVEREHAIDEQIRGLRKKLAEEALRRRQYPELVARWTDLPADGKALYLEVRKAYEKMSEETLEALVTRIMKMEDASPTQREALAERMRLSFEEARLHAPYFPLARFGNFWVSAEDAQGERAFFMYESHRAWRQGQKTLEREGYTIRDAGRRIESARRLDGASGSFVSEVEAILEEAGVDDNTRDEVYQLYLRTLPDLSQRKHFIHRKAVEGYSDDALRAFGSNMFHGAHQIARLKHTQDLSNLMNQMQKATAALPDAESRQRAGAIYNEMVKRHEWILNPRDSGIVSKISALNFVYYLGATPAAAIVNLSQTAMIALPVLGSRYGYRGANRELLKAMKLAGQAQLKNDFGDRLSGNEAEAYKTWIRLGIIDVTQAHALAEIGQTDSTQFNRTAHKAMVATSFLFHRAEMVNRQATALAAYRLAIRGGMNHEAATDYAGKATLEAHFDYSNANRARFMQSGTAKVLLAFRQYSLNMTWFLGRNAQQSFAGLTAEERSEARNKLAGALGMTALFAGATGLPLMWAVFGILNGMHALFGDDDDPWDAETAFQNWAVETFGHFFGTAATKGIGNAALGIDLGSRVSLNNIWLREADRELEGKAQYDYWLEQAAGPVGGMVSNVLRGKQLIQDGHIYRGIEAMVPKALRDAMKMARYATEGANTLRGDPLVPDVSFGQQIAQFAGFTPAEVAERYDANNAAQNYVSAVQKRRQSLLDGFAMAVRMEDGEAMEAGMAKIAKWNASHPENPIDESTVRRSMAARARASALSVHGMSLPARDREAALAQGAFAEE